MTKDWFVQLEQRKSDSICRDCAIALMGVWPKGHAATHWTGECGICGQNKGVCDVGDWNWPDRLPRGGRD